MYPHETKWAGYETGGGSTSQAVPIPEKRRVLGLSVPVFWGIVILLVLVLAGGIGGGVAGGLATQKSNSKYENPSLGAYLAMNRT
jgi:hypothetical protein